MGTKKNIIKKDNYKDSVFLMAIAGELEKLEDINSASLMMGTTANKEILETSDLLTDEGKDASENDLIIAIDADSPEIINKTLDIIEKKFNSTEDIQESSTIAPPTIETALNINKELNFTLISIAGQYAAREVHKALDNNLNVMIFSDNVSLEDEILLKNKAIKKGLLLMGPDCGTAIVNGVPLGFANRIPQGDIGIVAASGSGLQEVLVTISKQESGITQAFGTGGRDLSKDVGGLTMLHGLNYLKEDSSTKVIVLISKPPHPDIAKKIISEAQKISKPIIVCFLGSKENTSHNNIYFTGTLEGAGIMASQLSKGLEINLPEFTIDNIEALIQETKNNISSSGKYIRGLYAGGTLCDEAINILEEFGIQPYANVGVEEDYRLDDPNKSLEHTLVDMGDDEFTRGTPHPMIDLNLRNKRILQEAEDAQVAVILFDVVLGYGANLDPAGAMKDTLLKIKGKKVMVASVCGTDLDPQNYTKQSNILKECGVIVLPTNAQAAKFTAKVIK